MSGQYIVEVTWLIPFSSHQVLNSVERNCDLLSEMIFPILFDLAKCTSPLMTSLEVPPLFAPSAWRSPLYLSPSTTNDSPHFVNFAKSIVTISNVALAGEDEGKARIKITATRLTDVLIKSEHSFDFVVLAPVEPSFDKYVRNVTTPVVIAIEEQDDIRRHENNNFYRYGVSADEGNVLEYLIVLNAGNQGPQTDIVLNETLSHFVEYVSGSATLFYPNGAEEGVPLGSVEGCGLIERQWGCDFNEALLNITKNTSAHITYRVKVIGEDGDDSGEEKLGDAEVSKSKLGTPWGDGSAMSDSDTACWCIGRGNPADYCSAEGWVAGTNTATQGSKAEINGAANLRLQVATETIDPRPLRGRELHCVGG